MKKYLIVVVLCACVILLTTSLRPRYKQNIGVEQTLAYFREHAISFAESTTGLKQSIDAIKANDKASAEKAKNSLRKCRLEFKNIEFFFNYFFKSLSVIYNAPAVVEVEEPFMEYREPIGLQVIASLLFSDDPVANKEKMMGQVSLICESAGDLNSLLYNLPVSDSQVLESIQQELISVMALGIAGFDTPELKTGISEAGQTLNSFRTILSPYLAGEGKEKDSVQFYLDHAIKLVEKNEDFDSFDRLAFLTEAAIPLQYHLYRFIKENDFELNATKTLNYSAGNLFFPSAININGNHSADTAMAALGKRLFFEKALSGNNTRSCATCHQPGKYFTDGLPKSIAMDQHSTAARNAPSLLYTAFQYSQFWDGRKKTIEEQVQEVVNNPIEMDGNAKQIIAFLRSNSSYHENFKKLFGTDKQEEAVSMEHVATAISVYLKTLSPFSSPFDRYINGDKKAMSSEQVRGFNLFMGKALCGTCHTAPLFNGLTPPLYDRTTLEVIGATADSDLEHPRLSPDSGRHTTYPLSVYKGAFKTPGLRNVAMTAPYMHNGALPTLEKVLEFYNRGGGKGLGLSIPNQTLSSDSLRLDTKEIKSIVAFLRSLTDEASSFDK